MALRYAPFGRPVLSIVVAVGLWVAMFKSGIDPVISGVAIGMAHNAFPPGREDLERTTQLTKSLREQPTPELARSAQQSVLSSISPNERLQYDLHPWTSYVIVPLFALANAGIHLTGKLLGDAVTSPITLGILIGYVLGKPVGIYTGSWLATRPALHAPRSPVSGPVLIAGGACAGIGFTVSLLISNLAFTGERLDEARLGVIGTVVIAPLIALAVTRVIRRLPSELRARQIGRTAQDILDLADDIDPDRDHIRGPHDAPVTLVEYGDFECPYCGQAEPVIRELLSSLGADVRYVWRHLPLNDVHPHAQLAAEASEAAATQGKFWEMYDTLLSHQDALAQADLARYAQQLAPQRRPLLRRAAPTRVRAAYQRGRRDRRRERSLRHAHLLHKRPTPLRRLRHQHPHRRRPIRKEQSPDHNPDTSVHRALGPAIDHLPLPVSQ